MLAEAHELSLNAMMRRTEGRMRAVRDGGKAEGEDAEAAEKEEKNGRIPKEANKK